jgi:hypothetical protein
MATNGAAALHLAFEPTPASPSAQEDIRTAIGEAVASAATGLCQGVAEYQNGGLRPETRLANGERIARIYHLQQAHADKLDFPAVARAEGVRVLRQYFDASFYERYGPGAGEWTTNMIVDEVLAVVGRVTALEAAWAN